MAEAILIYFVALIMLLGLAGVFLPLLPGIELVWLAAVGYGIFHGFTWGGAASMLAITVLLAIGLSSDIWITGLGLRATKTSLVSVILGILALLIGSLFFTPLTGILLGLGTMCLWEYRRHRSWKKALASMGSAVAGCGLSYGFKFFLGLVMIGIWILWVFLA
jgi:uncharacterized protein YqgC (DUF456 family)